MSVHLLGGGLPCSHASDQVKASEWKRLVHPLFPTADGWAHRGKLTYRVPIRWVVVGVLGEASGFSKATYVWRVISPLFSGPGEHLDLSYSTRVSYGAHRIEDSDTVALQTMVVRAADGAPAELHALRHLSGLDLRPRNPRVYETVAYAQIVLGDVKAAKQALATAKSLSRDDDAAPAWMDKISERLSLVEGLLSDGLAPALDQLDRWAATTATALRIERSS